MMRESARIAPGRILSAIRKYLTTARVSLFNSLAYPAEFFAPLPTFCVLVFVFTRLYGAALPEGGDANIEGYTSKDLLYYFVIAELCVFGLGRMFTELSEEVKSGQIAYLLTRPFDFIRYQAAMLLGPSLAQVALLGAVGFLMGLLLAGPPLGLGLLQICFLVLSLGLSALIVFEIQICLAMLAFWFEENQAFYWIYQKFALLLGTLMPLEFLPPLARNLAQWTPFPSITYAPARIGVKFNIQEALQLMGFQILWILIIGLMARTVFSIGRRKIASNGG